MVGSVVVDAAIVDREAERRHEMRTALFGIEASAHGLSDGSSALTNVQVNQLAQAMVQEVRRLRVLLDERTASPTDFDLAAAIMPAVTTARASGQQVDCAIPRGVRVHGRDHVATQVVAGLLDNARRHAAGSRVQVHATVATGTVTLSVADRGPGIPRRLRRRVFRAGVRATTSTGSGLGLAIARRLMAEQGGSITARRRRGGGTAFLLTFRCAARP